METCSLKQGAGGGTLTLWDTSRTLARLCLLWLLWRVNTLIYCVIFVLLACKGGVFLLSRDYVCIFLICRILISLISLFLFLCNKMSHLITKVLCGSVGFSVWYESWVTDTQQCGNTRRAVGGRSQTETEVMPPLSFERILFYNKVRMDSLDPLQSLDAIWNCKDCEII